MDGNYVHANTMGGGYGGYGFGGGCGGFGGVGLVGLVGLNSFFGRDRDGHRDGCGKDGFREEIISDLTNRNIDSVREQVNKNALAAEIAGLTGRIQSQLGEMGTRAEFASIRNGDKICAVEGAIGKVATEIALLAKDQIASDLACCCKVENAIHCEGEKTRALIECNLVKELEGKLAAKTLEASQCKQNELWMVLSNKFDGLVKDVSNTNVNFGTQISQITTALNSLVAKG